MSGRVVHFSDNVPDAVYIGRAMPRKGLKASPWANPYKIGHMGWDRITVVELYESDLCDLDADDRRIRATLSDLPGLRGKPLACWCRHDGEAKTAENACHGDVLIDLLNTYTDDELRALAVTA